MIDWAFRSRQTGRITIVQAPNSPLGVFLAATVLRLVIRPSGSSKTALSVGGTLALVVWALDEVVRGVNPWRRALGAGLLIRPLRGLVTSRH